MSGFRPRFRLISAIVGVAILAVPVAMVGGRWRADHEFDRALWRLEWSDFWWRLTGGPRVIILNDSYFEYESDAPRAGGPRAAIR